MIRTLVVATVALLGLAGTLPGSRPAAAALIERQDIPGLFRVYDKLHLSGGSATGQTGFYDFYFSVGGRFLKAKAVATLFDSDPFLLSSGVEAKFIFYSQCCFSGPRRFVNPLGHEYVNENLKLIGLGAPVARSTHNPPYRLRVKVLDAPVEPYEFTWNGRILPVAGSGFNIKDHGIDATITDSNGLAVTPLPAGVLLLGPALVGLGFLSRWASRRNADSCDMASYRPRDRADVVP